MLNFTQLATIPIDRWGFLRMDISWPQITNQHKHKPSFFKTFHQKIHQEGSQLTEKIKYLAMLGRHLSLQTKITTSMLYSLTLRWDYDVTLSPLGTEITNLLHMDY